MQQPRDDEGLPQALNEAQVQKHLQGSHLFTRFSKLYNGSNSADDMNKFIDAIVEAYKVEPVSMNGETTEQRRRMFRDDWQAYIQIRQPQLAANQIWHKNVVINNARGFFAFRLDMTPGKFHKYVLVKTLHQWLNTFIVLICANLFEYGVDGKPISTGYQVLSDGGLFDHLYTYITARTLHNIYQAQVQQADWLMFFWARPRTSCYSQKTLAI